MQIPPDSSAVLLPTTAEGIAALRKAIKEAEDRLIDAETAANDAKLEVRRLRSNLKRAVELFASID